MNKIMIYFKKLNSIAMSALLVISALGLFSCAEPKPQPLTINVDNCDFCKMTISNPAFGAELLTKKGKVYKFDAIECMAGFYGEESVVKHEDIHSMWAINLTRPGDLIDISTAILFQCDELKSPMGGNYSAISSEDDFKRTSSSYQCRRLSWADIVQAEK